MTPYAVTTTVPPGPAGEQCFVFTTGRVRQTKRALVRVRIVRQRVFSTTTVVALILFLSDESSPPNRGEVERSEKYREVIYNESYLVPAYLFGYPVNASRPELIDPILISQ